MQFLSDWERLGHNLLRLRNIGDPNDKLLNAQEEQNDVQEQVGSEEAPRPGWPRKLEGGGAVDNEIGLQSPYRKVSSARRPL